MRDIRKLIGSNIRKIRKEYGWTQEELGFRAGVDASYIGSIERGRTNITLLTLEQIAHACRVPTVWFLQEEPVPTNETSSLLQSYQDAFEQLEPETQDQIIRILDILIIRRR